MHVFVFICVCSLDAGKGKVKCHTLWEAGGFDVTHVPSPILSPKISPEHLIRFERVERGG